MRSASAHLADNPSNYNPAAVTRLQRFHDGHEEVALLGTARGTRGRKTFCLGSYEGVGLGVGSTNPCVHFYSEELDYIRAGPGDRFRFFNIMVTTAQFRPPLPTWSPPNPYGPKQLPTSVCLWITDTCT